MSDVNCNYMLTVVLVFLHTPKKNFFIIIIYAYSFTSIKIVQKLAPNTFPKWCGSMLHRKFKMTLTTYTYLVLYMAS